ncbi:MAG: hypothetical protein DRP42_05445 [Tenericutes bacterium]|nr:MAG: hypothetical protein DRP42_05445 [Mycoplasmatota bacterium]
MQMNEQAKIYAASIIATALATGVNFFASSKISGDGSGILMFELMAGALVAIVISFAVTMIKTKRGF